MVEVDVDLVKEVASGEAIFIGKWSLVFFACKILGWMLWIFWWIPNGIFDSIYLEHGCMYSTSPNATLVDDPVERFNFFIDSLVFIGFYVVVILVYYYMHIKSIYDLRGDSTKVKTHRLLCAIAFWIVSELARLGFSNLNLACLTKKSKCIFGFRSTHVSLFPFPLLVFPFRIALSCVANLSKERSVGLTMEFIIHILTTFL
ncbi:hypothetical protein Ocin01_06076 [Orchesella cincta]|uniref:Uncharacterized protein n=1 Tax=Orchesella cincta TaxID=48709 RepID=A0A1D2N5Q6_ORCCI|nr:hypothetical protein Ocin01_06076 [Orchesella cincta]